MEFLRMSRLTLLLFIAVLSAALPSRAFANVVGSDAQNFHPTTNGLDFVTVQSSETLKPGVINLGLFFNGAWNALPRFVGQPPYSDRLFGMDFSFGMGLAERWDFGVGVPSILDQRVSNQTGFRGSYSQNGLTEIKVNTKYRLIGNDDGGVAFVGSANFNLITNNPYAGNGAGPTYNLEAVYDRTFGPFAAAVNAGYRIRNSGTLIAGIPIRPFGNQWIGSLAGNYLIPATNTKVILEVFGSLPTSSTTDDLDRQSSSLEALLGVKNDFTTNFAGHAGIGREVITGLASPSFRAYVGINYQFGPVFSDREKIEPKQTGFNEQEGIEETFVLRTIKFAFDSAELSPQARPILDDLAEFLRRNEFRLLTIEGHTDSIGSESYNQILSARRANSILTDLVKTYHFPPQKFVSEGFGESRPIADNGNYQGREMNRRVEFKIRRMGKGKEVKIITEQEARKAAPAKKAAPRRKR